MKRLIALYPSAWRARYGEEFAALLEELRPSPALFADVVIHAIGTRLEHAPASVEKNPMSEMFGHRDDTRDTRLALLALALVLPTCVFLTLSVLKYGLGVNGPFDAAESFFLNRAVEAFTVLAPAVALAVSILPVVRIRIGWDDGRITGLLAVRARPLNLVAALVSGAIVAVLVAYFFVENVLGKGA